MIAIDPNAPARTIAEQLWRQLGSRKALHVRTMLTKLERAREERRRYPTIVDGSKAEVVRRARRGAELSEP